MSLSRPLALLAGLALVGSLAACSEDDASSGTTVDIVAGDDTCEVADTSLDAGDTTFKIENTGSKVTEVYVYGKSGDDFTKIVTELENIAPGVPGQLNVDLAAGDYQIACKPGMQGDGIRTDISVTGEGGGSTEAEDSYDRELEFEVTQDGKVEAPTDLDGTVGETIEFKLHNHNDAEYYLELFDPKGDEIGEGEAHGGEEAEFISELDEAGDYTVKVFEDGAEDRATSLTLTVSEQS